MTTFPNNTFALLSQEISYVGSGNTSERTRATLLFFPCPQSRSCALAFRWNRGLERLPAEVPCDTMPEILCLFVSENMMKRWGFPEKNRKQFFLKVEGFRYRYDLDFCRELWAHMTSNQLWTVVQL